MKKIYNPPVVCLSSFVPMTMIQTTSPNGNVDSTPIDYTPGE